MFSLGGLFGTKKPPQQVAITPPEVPPTTTPQDQTRQPDKLDTTQAIYTLRTKMKNEVFSTYKPRLHQFIQGISGEIYNTSLNSQITEQINTIISELYSKSKEELTKIDPTITVDMFETGNIQLPDKISKVFQLKTTEYLGQLEEFYLKRIESVLHDKFDPLLVDTPAAPKRLVEPKSQESYKLPTNEPRPNAEQFAEWQRRYEGGSLSRFSKKKKKTKKKRRATKKRKNRPN
jgi:hypothetical protein